MIVYACANNTGACAYFTRYRAEKLKMTEVRLGMLHGGKALCGSVCVEIEEDVTCRELAEWLATDEGVGEPALGGGAERGAWHLVERWNGCGKLCMR